ncbi:MAG: hypothetical protein O7A67_02520 [SAR324 cluster bacterium]|nr:hypothetical protein [SAR324 cluster bacterium]
MKRLTTRLATIGLALMASAAFVAPAAFAADPACDYNGDGACDKADLDILMGAYGTQEGDPGFVAAADHDGDGAISMVDTLAFVRLSRN